VVKIVFVARRREGMSVEEFKHYWEHEHGPLVRELQDTLRMQRYVQSPTLDTPLNAEFAASRGMSLDAIPDGIAEAWYDSIEDMRAGFEGETGQRAAARLAEDEERFIDHARCIAFMTEETQIL
jgi:uncharacterized protein (TIGR02118 family)